MLTNYKFIHQIATLYGTGNLEIGTLFARFFPGKAFFPFPKILFPSEDLPLLDSRKLYLVIFNTEQNNKFVSQIITPSH